MTLSLYVAKYGTLGNAYEPSEQIAHGGGIFTGRAPIPFYNPGNNKNNNICFFLLIFLCALDHGPTVSEEEAKPPIPEYLRPITEVINNPFVNLINKPIFLIRC